MARESWAIDSLQSPAVKDFVRHMSSTSSIWQKYVRKISVPTCLSAPGQGRGVNIHQSTMTELRGTCETRPTPERLDRARRPIQ